MLLACQASGDAHQRPARHANWFLPPLVDVQLEGFKLQRQQKLGEEAETKKKLEAAKTELARNQGDPDVPNHPDVLAAMRDAYQSAQVRQRHAVRHCTCMASQRWVCEQAAA